MVKVPWADIAAFEGWRCRCRLAKTVVWQVLRGRFVAVGIVVADWAWNGEWQKVTFRLVKPYVLRCETYGLGLQNVWFRLWRVLVAFFLVFSFAFPKCVCVVCWRVWWWLVGTVSEEGKSSLCGVRKCFWMWKLKGSQSFDGTMQAGGIAFYMKDMPVWYGGMRVSWCIEEAVVCKSRKTRCADCKYALCIAECVLYEKRLHPSLGAACVRMEECVMW